MTDTKKVDHYLVRLKRHLHSIPASDSEEIVDEIRAHLLHRSDEGALDSAILALGSPDQCAQSFLDEFRIQDAYADGGPTKTFGTLLALASRKIVASIGLFASGLFFAFAIGFAISAVMDVVAPNLTGLWVDANSNLVGFGVVLQGDNFSGREILGRWMIPVAAALAVLFFVTGQWIGRFFLKQMRTGTAFSK